MTKRKQNAAPMLVDPQGRARRLEPALGAWSEDQLQEFLYEHPDVLPVEHIEPFFAPLVPLAREVRLESGRLENESNSGGRGRGACLRPPRAGL